MHMHQVQASMQHYTYSIAFVDIPTCNGDGDSQNELEDTVYNDLGTDPWQCSCGAWNADGEPCANIQPWKGSGNNKRLIPIAVCADGCPLSEEEMGLKKIKSS